ncbi:hypothetical protein [Streptomyces sp. AC495_CC817]|uniref:hypothetical protein n=1 Tax=Streptomyces sp. AC495_CC817 TaxID=2823900 RepID=UPI001C264833|nr:hypothetical protein [Streptomyces sp. AC495_CC817]
MSNDAPARERLSFKTWLLIAVAAAAGIALMSVLYNAATGAFNAAQKPEVTTVENTVTVSEGCMSSMHTAAGVQELDNDTELLATLSSCSTTDEWVQALKANPGAGALTSYSTADAEEFLSMACVKAPETPVCVDAAAAGRLS